MRLTPKQQAFARAYASNGFNAAAAARRAGYAQPHEETGRQALRSIGVRAKLEELLMDARREATAQDAEAVMAAAEVLARASAIARASIGSLLCITPGGDAYLDLSRAGPNELYALADVSVEHLDAGRGEEARRVRRVRVKLADKLKALDLLARHYGLLVERVELKAVPGLAEQLEAARLRALEDRIRRSGEPRGSNTSGAAAREV